MSQEHPFGRCRAASLGSECRGSSLFSAMVLVLADIGTSLPLRMEGTAGTARTAACWFYFPYISSPGPRANIWEAERGKLL